MDQRFREEMLLLDIDPETSVDASEATRAAEAELGKRLPASVVELLRYPGAMDSIAKANGFHADFPRSLTLADAS